MILMLITIDIDIITTQKAYNTAITVIGDKVSAFAAIASKSTPKLVCTNSSTLFPASIIRMMIPHITKRTILLFSDENLNSTGIMIEVIMKKTGSIIKSSRTISDTTNGVFCIKSEINCTNIATTHAENKPITEKIYLATA